MSSPLELQPLTPRLGARVVGLDPASDLSQETFGALYQAFLRHQVLVFAPLDLPPTAQVAFARRFGEMQVHVMSVYHADGFPELYRLSNLDDQGRPNGKHPDKGTLAWHTDGSWQRLTGQATIIYGERVPPHGGETHFCDMAGAYERLDAGWKRRINGLRAVHNLDFSRTRRHAEDPLSDAQRRAKPPVDHPVVRVHPQTGRRCLVWDNRSLLHRATAFDTAQHARVVRRCTVLGEVPVGDVGGAAPGRSGSDPQARRREEPAS